MICWYDANKKVLNGNKWAKIKAYNRNHLIKDLGLGLFELMPLKGNKQRHTVFFDGFNNSCTCQNFVLNGDFYCSHILSVKYYCEVIRK